MAVDLVSVKVGVVGVAVCVVHPNRLVSGVAEDSHAVSHDARLVECRLPVDQHAVPVVQMPPHLFYQNAAVAKFASIRGRGGKRQVRSVSVVIFSRLAVITLPAPIFFRRTT